MTPQSHLTEDERHGLADGSLSADQRATADAHARACPECAKDVDRIRTLMTRVNDSVARRSTDKAEIDELWPSIWSRIERQKVVGLGAGSAGAGVGVAARRRVSRRWLVGLGGLVAAGIMAFWFARGRALVEPTGVSQVVDSGMSFVALVDSTHAYQQEAQALLNHLELERATLRPELARAFERDLRVIDVAIAELQDAIRNDPNNPALRRLLAASYRQKVDLLKRVSNAG